MKATQPAIALVTAIAPLIAGCSLTPRHTITAQEAVRVMDTYLHETVTSVPSALIFSHREVNIDYTGGCTKYPVGDNFTGQIMPDMAYIAATSKNNDTEATQFLHAVASYWKEKSAPVESNPDGYTIRPYKNNYELIVSYYPETHLLELAAALRACIWRYGTPQPDDNP